MYFHIKVPSKLGIYRLNNQEVIKRFLISLSVAPTSYKQTTEETWKTKGRYSFAIGCYFWATFSLRKTKSSVMATPKQRQCHAPGDEAVEILLGWRVISWTKPANTLETRIPLLKGMVRKERHAHRGISLALAAQCREVSVNIFCGAAAFLQRATLPTSSRCRVSWLSLCLRSMTYWCHHIP